MEAVTISEAKARLHALVEAAERGEQVVLMRGSRLVAAIVPVSAADFELAPRLSDAQAERLWSVIHDERQDGSAAVFESPSAAVEALSATRRRPGRGSRVPSRRR